MDIKTEHVQALRDGNYPMAKLTTIPLDHDDTVDVYLEEGDEGDAPMFIRIVGDRGMHTIVEDRVEAGDIPLDEIVNAIEDALDEELHVEIDRGNTTGYEAIYDVRPA